MSSWIGLSLEKLTHVNSGAMRQARETEIV